MEIIICGPIRAEYFILPDKKSYPKVLGGPALYAAAGTKIWTSQEIGIISRVGDDFSAEEIRNFKALGINGDGIHVIPGKRSPVGFYCFENFESRIDWDPIKYYSKYGLPFPSNLQGYSIPSLGEESGPHFTDLAIRKEDIPYSFRQARAVYISPCHYLSQLTVSESFRQYGAGTVILSPSDRLVSPSWNDQMRNLLLGIDIFFCRDEWIKKIFEEKFHDPRDVAAYISLMGPKIVLIQYKNIGVNVYDADSKIFKYIPFYSANIKNPYGIGDAFCGGFLIGWRKTYDPMESSLYGCVSASLAMERIGALTILERTPGLEEARLTSLRKSLSKEDSRKT